MMSWESPMSTPSSSMKGTLPLGARRKSAICGLYGTPAIFR